ncbi:MAG: L-2-amino-thiazoline-4-carboxylic acid hydrolase [Patescibacteria group bacterium]
MRAFRIWRRALSNRWSREEAGRFIRFVQERYEALRRRQRWPVKRKLAWHLDEFILPGLALYQELQATGLAREEAFCLATELFAAWAGGLRKRYARLGRLPFFFSLLRAVVRVKIKLDYPSAGWDTEWLEVSGDRIAFNMRRCFYHDIMMEHRTPELTRLFCGYDDLLFEKMSPCVRWQRTQTIANGGSLCDFRFEYVRRGQRRKPLQGETG